jgi:alkyl hydroperoxide reductase subunit AhpC
MILQKHEEANVRTIQVKKNRYDGEVGYQHLAFNSETRRYFEISNYEYSLIADGKGTVKRLIEYRKQKFNGEVEPELALVAEGNGRV